MVSSSREAKEDFNEFADDNAIIYAANKIKALEVALMEESGRLTNRLLNAFQLVKNGKKIGYLKFDQFCERMDIKHDFNGNEEKQ